MSTKEIEKNISHCPKEELHSILRSLNSQGLIVQRYSFGIETWENNSDVSLNLSNAQSVSSRNANLSGGRIKTSPALQTKSAYYQVSPQNKQRNQLTNIAVVAKTPLKTNFMVSSDVFNALNKNPVSALNELCQKNGASVSFKQISENMHNQKNKFTVAALVNGKLYDGATASNLKDAKREAADIALKVFLFLYKALSLLPNYI